MKCEPATQIIAALGGLTIVADAAGVTITSVQRWRMPAAKGGTGGYIPRKYHEKLTELAVSKGVDLPTAAFIDASAMTVPVDPAPASENERAA